MSDENVSKIIITGDSTGFEAATKRSKDAAAGLADAVKKAGEDQREAFKPIGDSAEKEARRVERETKTMLASVQRSTADLVAEGKKSVKLETLLDFKGIDKAPFDAVILKLREYEQAQEKVAIASRAAAAAAGSVTAPMNAMGMSAKAYSNALRNVPAQFTDIVTSLQAGQAPMTVFLQQGGQLKDLFGGAGNAAKALGGYVLGLLNPLTVTAGAAAALAVAYHQGAAESEAFNKSLIMTGNIAGTTAGQLGDMARTVAGSSGATIGAVAETLNEITASGKVSADMLAKVAQAAIDMERAGGSAAADTVKEFSSLGDAPVSALIKLNDKYHFLTASVYEQVKALQDQGRETDAAKLAQDTYANAIESRVPSLVQNLGFLESAWKSITSGAKGAWDAMAGIGRSDSLNDQLAAVTTKIASYKSMGFGSSGTVWDKVFSVADLEKQQRVLQAMIEGERSVAAQVAAQNKAREAGLAWAQESTKYADQQAKKQAEILRVTTMMTEAGKSQTEIAKVLTQIEEKYAEKKGASARAVKEDFTELFQRAEQMKTIYAALGIEFKEIEKQNDDYAKSIAALIDPVEKEADSLERQAETYGLTRSQIEQTTIARLEEAKALAAMNGAGDDAIAFYEREIDARKRIAAASASIESRKATDDAAKHAADEWKKTADKIGDSITDALMRGFESGKTFAENLRDTVENMFKTLVLRPIIQVTVTGGLSALGMGSSNALAGTASSAGSLGNLASLGQSAWGPYTGGIGSAYGAFASSGVGSALGLSTQMAPGYMAPVYGAEGTLLSTGTGTAAGGLTSAGASIGAALPYVGLAAAAAALLSSSFGSGGTPHAGGIAFSTPTGTVTPNTAAGIDSVYKDANGVRLGDQFAENDWTESFSKSVADSLTPTAETINGILNSAATTFGKKAGYTTGLAFSSDGEDRSRGRLGIVDGSGSEVAQIMERYSSDAAEGVQELIGYAGGSVRQALDAMNLPGWANNMLSALGETPSVDSLASTVTQINAIATAAKTLAPAFQMAEADFAKIYLKAGADAVNAYYNATTTAAEKQAAQLNQITDAFGNLGYSLPDSIESFRALAESQDATTAAGQNTIASLMGLTAQFAQFRSSIDGLQSSASSAIDAFRTSDQVLSKNQQTLAELSEKAGIAIPTMASELVEMFDSIDFANPTTEGLALAAALPGIASAFSSVSQAAKAAEEAAKAAEEAAKATAAATAAAHSALLQSAQEAIGAAVDSDYSALERAVAAQKTSLETAYSAQDAINQSAITASTKIRDNLSSLADTLKNAVGTITADADSNLLASRNAAQAVLNNAYAASQSGQSLDPYSESIKSAITELSKPSDQLYSTYEEYARTQGRANAAISALSVAAGDQLDVADLTLKAIKDAAYSAEESYKKALADLDATLENAKAQIDALRGINTSVLSVKDAIDALALSLAAAAGTKVAPTASTVGKWTSTNDGQYYQSSAGAVLTRDAGSSDTIIHTADGYSGTVAQAVASVNSQTSEQVYAATKEAGLTLSELNQIMGWDAGRAENWARENNLPTFAVGTNFVPSDMTAQIHQGERIIPAADNRMLMSRLAANDSNTDLLAELKALREEVNLLRYEARATASNTGKAAKTLDKFDVDGMPAERIAA